MDFQISFPNDALPETNLKKERDAFTQLSTLSQQSFENSEIFDCFRVLLGTIHLEAFPVIVIIFISTKASTWMSRDGIY